jgi:hypothetical protein
MVRICKEESFHQRQGFDILLALSRGNDVSKSHVPGCDKQVVVAFDDDVWTEGQ